MEYLLKKQYNLHSEEDTRHRTITKYYILFTTDLVQWAASEIILGKKLVNHSSDSWKMTKDKFRGENQTVTQ